MKVIVAVDRDLESHLALRYACHLVEHVEAEVDAIHVKKDVGNIILEDFDIPFLKTDHRQKIEAQAKVVQQAISDACEICLEGKVPCEPRVLTGKPAEVILREASVGDFDLIVLGCHHSSALREMLLGQVHTQVMNHATRPVLIVRELRKIQRVLVAYSGSSCDESALNFLAPMLLKKKPEITLIHVRDTDDNESQEFADACILRGESILKQLEHQPRTKLVTGNVVEEVLRELTLDNYDLVVLGAYGFSRSGPFNILSEKPLQIIRRTTRPVLLYRPKV
ncbi:MAG: universal stress protein [Deltaproteobacteria bacterium]|nr:MAG: universal stress protein [Deltaproteobacteria bacterium]